MLKFEISKSTEGSIKPCDEFIFDVLLKKNNPKRYNFWTLPSNGNCRPAIEIRNVESYYWYLENGSKLSNPHV